MAIQYRIYKSPDAGGPVDYSTVVATVTSGTTWASSPIPTGSDVTYAVRAFDTVSGLEERNVTAAVRQRSGGSGQDLAAVPNAALAVAAVATGTTSVQVAWVYEPGEGRPLPTGFKVYASTTAFTATPPAGLTPKATVAYVRGQRHYTAGATGLAAGTAYFVTAVPYNAAGDCPDYPVAKATTPASALAAPEAYGSFVATGGE